MPTWIVVGASRGIGLEFVRQLLAQGNHVIGTVRDPEKASQLWALAGAAERGSCQLLECNVDYDSSIDVCQSLDCVWYRVKPDCGQKFVNDVVKLQGLHRIDYVVLNAGILRYPNVSLVCILQTVS